MHEREETLPSLKSLPAARPATSPARPGTLRGPEAIERPDDCENKWFPIIKAALEHRHPTVHDDVFRNLSQTEGPELSITMNTLIQRLDMLKQGTDTQKEAHDLLTRRTPKTGDTTTDTLGGAID